MFTRPALLSALAVFLVAGSAYAAGRGGGGGHGGGGGGHGGGGGGRSSSGSRAIIAGPYNIGARSGAFFGTNSIRNGGFAAGGLGYGGYGGYGYGGCGYGSYGNVGYGGMGVAMGPPIFLPPPPPMMPPLIGPGNSGPGTILFSVPENALVWIDNHLLDQTGTDRDFGTPPLKAQTSVPYLIRVKWTENGEEKSFSQRVWVRAGGQASVMILSRKPGSKPEK